jgi:hypothetical protein
MWQKLEVSFIRWMHFVKTLLRKESMRAIKINPLVNEISEVELDGSSLLSSLYKEIDCDTVEVVCRSVVLTDGTELYLEMFIDESGRLKTGGVPFYIRVNWNNEIIMEDFRGVAVVTGPVDAEGNTTALPDTVTVEIVKDVVEWLPQYFIKPVLVQSTVTVVYLDRVKADAAMLDKQVLTDEEMRDELEKLDAFGQFIFMQDQFSADPLKDNKAFLLEARIKCASALNTSLDNVQLWKT